MVINNFSEIPKAEQLEFIDSFDRVLVDMDGVIWLTFVPILDAQTCLENLKKLGKSVNFITNFAVSSRDVTHERLIKNKFKADLDDVLNPCLAAIDYLKKINFQKKIYTIASQNYKAELRKAGFNIAEDPPQEIEESVSGVIKNIQDDEKIGAVLYDYDLNLTFIKLQKALTYLKRPDCLFITGGADKALPIGPLGPVIGNFYNYQSICELSGREPLQLAKPSKEFNQFVTETLKIKNPERVLFIGDMINEDMGFAAYGGFKKLLVLSGNTKINDINNWKHPEEYKPNYYIESLTELNKIIKTNHKL